MLIGPREYLKEMMGVMGRAMGGRSRYRTLLGEKAEEAMGSGVCAGLGAGGAAGVMPSVEVVPDAAREGVKGRVVEILDEPEGLSADDVKREIYEALNGVSVAWVGALGEAYPVAEEGVVYAA